MRKRLELKNLFLWMTLCLSLSACQTSLFRQPEPDLLRIFQNELQLLKNYENRDYVSYMKAQNTNYKKHRAWTNSIIKEVNAKYDSMSDSDKIDYQQKWRKKFQPVIDEIYTRTKALVVRQTEALTPEKMAEIKSFAVKRKAMENELPTITLKPQFYVLPEDKEF